MRHFGLGPAHQMRRGLPEGGKIMSPVTVGIVGILLLFLLLAMRMQIGFNMVLVGFLGFAVLNALKPSFIFLGMEPFKIGAAYSLMVIPLFILIGQFGNHSRMGFEVYQTVYRWIGFLPGGLSMATIAACGGFAAITGSSLAAAATMGMVALPEMKRFKYEDALATGCIAAGGTLGILIPAQHGHDYLPHSNRTADRYTVHCGLGSGHPARPAFYPYGLYHDENQAGAWPARA